MSQIIEFAGIQSALEMIPCTFKKINSWARRAPVQEDSMKHILLAGAAAMALTASLAHAEQVTVFGPWLGPDQENVEAVLAAFAEASGNDVRYVGSDSFEQQILVDAEAGSAANVSVFPQPGLAADMASRGFLTPLADGTADWVR
jgi:alpha-glucoside transport system substrate-binding protein